MNPAQRRQAFNRRIAIRNGVHDALVELTSIARRFKDTDEMDVAEVLRVAEELKRLAAVVEQQPSPPAPASTSTPRAPAGRGYLRAL